MREFFLCTNLLHQRRSVHNGAHLFILLFSFQFTFFLWRKLGFFLLFPFAFIFTSLITHSCISVSLKSALERCPKIPCSGCSSSTYLLSSGFAAVKAKEELKGLRVDPNTASPGELQELPGIGPELADRLIENRPYKRVEDLVHVPGIGSKTVEKLRPYLDFSEVK